MTVFGTMNLTLTPALFCIGVPLIAQGVQGQRETDKLAPLVGLTF